MTDANITYDVEADWILLRTCNFRCAYCAIPLEELGSKIVTFATPAEWLAAFNATGKRWLLHITGGEPSIYPNFVELCRQVTRNHYLAMHTNLSHPCLDEFCDTIDPDRVHYLNAALHHDERDKRDSLSSFTTRVRQFRSRGFDVLVSAVMTPAMVQAFPWLQEQCEAHGISIIPKAMRGWYEGSLFPDSYTDSQRKLIRNYLRRAREDYAGVSRRLNELATINMLEDERFLERVPGYHGKLCAAGSKFVQIAPDGTVLRCNSGQSLGNVLKRDLKLFNSPRRCDTSYCPYFCEKYTNPPFVAAQDAFAGSLVTSLHSVKLRVKSKFTQINNR